MGGAMRSFLFVTLAATLLPGCSSMPERDRNTISGAAVGAGSGALVGWAAGGPSGAWIGAAVGGAAGGAIGYLIRPEGCFIQYSNGQLWQVDCNTHPIRAPGCYVGNEIMGLKKVACPHGPKRRPARNV